MKLHETPTSASKNLRRVLVAAPFAAAIMLGTTTGTLADPATACAAPDRDLIRACVAAADEQYRNGFLTREQWDQKVTDCCYAGGGEIHLDEKSDLYMDCVDPDTGETVYMPAPPRGPDLTHAPPGLNEATLAPVPPPPPTATVAPSQPPAKMG